MHITKELFDSICIKLRNGELISGDVSEILQNIETNENYAQVYLIEFLNRIVENNSYNVKIMNVINSYLDGEIDINTLSYKLFNEGKKGYEEWDDLFDESLILHDNCKRGLIDYIYPYKKAQFYHFEEGETIFEKMIRVLFEFTRGDDPYIRGVCFDYCIFLAALNILKEGKTDFIIVCGIEPDGPNYFILRSNKKPEILDPFNGVYINDMDKYKCKVINHYIVPTGKNLVSVGDYRKEIGIS